MSNSDGDPATETQTYYFDEWDTIPCEIIDIVLGEILVKVGARLGGGFSLWWSDGVANDWTEVHSTLSALFLRLGALMKCSETDGGLWFATSNPQYWGQHVARRFFNNSEVFVQ
jgi:hypothetical protein